MACFPDAGGEQMAERDGDNIHGRERAVSAPKPSSWIGRLRERWRSQSSRRDAVHRLYASVVEQSRHPTFYAAWGVPDSREGRLEMLNLHAMLAMRRLRGEGQEGRAVAQDLFDLMFLDLDRHLREWGVGDLSVGKHVKQLAQSFFARAAALDPLLDAGDATGVAEVLRRNVYGDAPSSSVAELAAYLLFQESRLASSDGTAIVRGRVAFALPDAGTGGSCVVDRPMAPP